MTFRFALVPLSALLLPSCTNKAIIVEEAIPKAEVLAAGPSEAGAPSAPGFPSPSRPVPFRTPTVTSSLVEERDLLTAPPAGGDRPPGADDAGSGTVTTRPPASDDSE